MLTFVGVGTGAGGGVINAPSARQPGDRLFVTAFTASGGGGSVPSISSGWTLAGAQMGTFSRLGYAAWWRTADGTAADNPTVAAFGVSMVCYRGVGAPLNVTGAWVPGLTAPGAQTLTLPATAVTGSLEIIAGFVINTGFTTPTPEAGFTLDVNAQPFLWEHGGPQSGALAPSMSIASAAGGQWWWGQMFAVSLGAVELTMLL